jgi:hypothetical protein
MREPRREIGERVLLLATAIAALALGCGDGSAGPAPVTSPGPGDVAGWRPFAATSPWNTRIPADAALEPDGAALVADLATSSPYGAHLDVNITGYSIPLYWADASTPTQVVIADLGGEGWSSSDGFDAVAEMPLPAGAAPDPASDHHLLVVDPSRNLEWGCWNARNESGQWRGGVCATADLAGSGVRQPATSASPWWVAHGARACGFPLVAGLIRAEEIASGRIDHALVLAYPRVRSGWFTPPASTGSALGAPGTEGIPCGGRIQLDPTVDPGALGLTRSGRIILTALQEYGAYVGDYSGAISLYADGSASAQAYWSAGVLDSYELLGKLDFSRLRVLRFDTMYDNGNGY